MTGSQPVFLLLKENNTTLRDKIIVKEEFPHKAYVRAKKLDESISKTKMKILHY